MKNQNITVMNITETSLGFLDFTLKNLQIMRKKEFWSKAFEITVNLDFWCSHNSNNNGGKPFPLLPFRNSYKAC